jgi:hypothetical protein
MGGVSQSHCACLSGQGENDGGKRALRLAGLAAPAHWASPQQAAQPSDGRGQRHALTRRGGKQINTSFMERFQATMRERLAALTRQGRHARQRLEAVQWGMDLLGWTSKLCWVHQHLGRPPAMAAGLADHAWSSKEVLCSKVAPAPFEAPTRPRGRPRTRPQGDGPPVKASLGRPSRSLSVLRRLQPERQAPLPQGPVHPPVNVAVPQEAEREFFDGKGSFRTKTPDRPLAILRRDDQLGRPISGRLIRRGLLRLSRAWEGCLCPS